MTRRAAFLVGLCTSFVAALPAARRFEPTLFWQALAVCGAGSALVMAPLAAALAGPAPRGRFRQALTVGVLFAGPLLLPFAALLKTTTHHRPLGGVTFAVGAGVLISGSSLIAARALTWSGAQPSNSRQVWVSRAALVLLSALGAAALLRGLMSGLQAEGTFASGFFDGLRVLALATLAARVPVPASWLQRARGLELATWILVVTVGVCLGRAPAMQAELAARSPVLHWPLLWLGG